MFFFFFIKLEFKFKYFCRFCGPGTKLKAKLNQQGINPLDSACKEHDIAYEENSDLKNRHIADKILSEKAKSRIFSKSASLGEKLSSAGVYAIMNLKRKIGAGIRKRKKSTRKRQGRGFFLPALATISAGASAIRAIQDLVKAGKTLKQEAKQGNGLYLRPYKKSGKGLRKKKKKVEV